MQINSKKVVLVLVDGPSDVSTVINGFTNYYQDKFINVRVYPLRFDITFPNKSSNITDNFVLNKVTEVIKQACNKYKFRKADIINVVEIIDIDGVYINDSLIEEHSNLDHCVYYEDKIEVNNKEFFVRRNKIKRDNIDKLVHTKNVYDGLPYEIYFFATNLEHYFYNKLNCEDSEKEDLSLRKADAYKQNPEQFLSELKEFKTTNSEYIESWREIENIHDKLSRLNNL